jgi:circadian clock protein KaiB
MSKRGASGSRFVFRLYIAGDAPHSAQAVANFKVICQKYLQDCHEIEVIDVLKDPLRALKDGVLVTPTLVKVSPAPPTRIIGDLSQTTKVIWALGLGEMKHE